MTSKITCYFFYFFYPNFDSSYLKPAKISAIGIRKIILSQRLNNNNFHAPLVDFFVLVLSKN